MAKIRTGEHIQDIRGKSGNHVYSNWRGRSYMRSKAINPANPRSSAQATLRSSMPRFSHLWSKSLTDAQRALWNEYAQREGKVKGSRSMSRLIIPPPGVIGSGFNMFVRNNILLQSAGIQVPPAYLAIPPDSTDVVSTSPLDLAGSFIPDPAVYLQENFEDEAIGSKPNTWTPAWTYTEDPNGFSDVTVQAAPTCTGTKIACACKTVVFPSVSYASYPVPQFANDGVYVRYYARAAQLNKTAGMLYLWRGHTTVIAQAAVSVAFFANGKILYKNGAAWVDTGISYNITQCYKIEYVLHDPVFKYDLWIDDVLIAMGINYRNNVNANRLTMPAIGGPTMAIYYTDDVLVEAYRTRGFNLSWTDPVNAPAGSRIRVWLRSFGVSAHLQQVNTVALGVEAFCITQVRTAQGRSVDVSLLPGAYQIQLDSVSSEGRQSAPSNLISVNVS